MPPDDELPDAPPDDELPDAPPDDELPGAPLPEDDGVVGVLAGQPASSKLEASTTASVIFSGKHQFFDSEGITHHHVFRCYRNPSQKTGPPDGLPQSPQQP